VPLTVDGFYESQIETIKDLKRRLIPQIVDDFLAEQQPNQPEVVENKREAVVNLKRRWRLRSRRRLPKESR
jgi:hypothetical protein